MRTINRIVIHCAATGPNQDIGAKDIDRWHRERGFTRIGYHYVIRRDGTLETGRPVEEVGAHAVGHNADSIGICMAGGVSQPGPNGKPENNYTPAQWATLKRIVGELRQRFPKTDILGHRDLPGVAKACPSFDARAWAKTSGF